MSIRSRRTDSEHRVRPRNLSGAVLAAVFVLLALSAVAISCVTAGAVKAAPEPPEGPQPPEGVGGRIGTIITATIKAALPGVSELRDLLWGSRKPDGKITKQELDAELKKVQDELRKEALARVRRVGAVAEELAVVDRFLQPTVTAQEAVQRMQLRLSNARLQKDSTPWTDLDADWAVASHQLEELSKVPEEELNKVSDSWLHSMLSKIRRANGTQAAQVAQYLKDREPARAASALADLESKLSDMASAVGFELLVLRKDLDELTRWAGGGGLGLESLQGSAYMQILERKHRN